MSCKDENFLSNFMPQFTPMFKTGVGYGCDSSPSSPCAINLTSEDAATELYSPAQEFQITSGKTATVVSNGEVPLAYVGTAPLASATPVDWEGERIIQGIMTSNAYLPYMLLIRSSDKKAVGVRQQSNGQIRPMYGDLSLENSFFEVLGMGADTGIPFNGKEISFSVNGTTGAVEIYAGTTLILDSNTIATFGEFASISDFALGEDVVLSALVLSSAAGQTTTFTVNSENTEIAPAVPYSPAFDWCGNVISTPEPISCSITLTGDIGVAAGYAAADISGQTFSIDSAPQNLYFASTPYESPEVRRPMPAAGKKVWLEVGSGSSSPSVEVRGGFYLFDGAGAPLAIVSATQGNFIDTESNSFSGIVSLTLFDPNLGTYPASITLVNPDAPQAMPQYLSLAIDSNGEVYFFDRQKGEIVAAADIDPAFAGYLSNAASLVAVGYVEGYSAGMSGSLTFVTNPEDMKDAWAFPGDEDWCRNEISVGTVSTIAVTENSIVQWGSVDSVVGFSADTVIDSSNPDTNFWSGSDYYVDKWETGNTINYIWMVGGITEIPPGATIVDARLRLRTHSSGSANGDDSFIIGVYGILPPGGIEPSQITWNDAATGIPWTVPGAWGDLINPVGSDYVGVGTAANTWHEWDVTELVQLALADNPTNMSGAFLLERADINEHGHATSYVGQTRRFWPDTGTDGSRPELIIRYVVPT